MLSWKLWRALQHPPISNPIYERVLKAPHIAFHRYGFGIWLLLFPLLFCGGVSALTRITIYSLVIFIMQLYVIYTTVHSLTWAINISSTVVKAHEQKTHDVLCVTPFGTWGVYWAIYTACLYRKKEFLNFDNELTWLTRFLFAIPTVVISIDIFGSNSITRNGFVVLIFIVTMILALYIDQVQSVLLGNLLGMLIPSIARNRTDSRLFVAASFVLIQMVSYFVIWLTGFALLDVFYTGFVDQNGFIAATLAILRLVIFYGVRESIIQVLWQTLAQRLNIVPGELHTMTSDKRKV